MFICLCVLWLIAEYRNGTTEQQFYFHTLCSDTTKHNTLSCSSKFLLMLNLSFTWIILIMHILQLNFISATTVVIVIVIPVLGLLRLVTDFTIQNPFFFHFRGLLKVLFSFGWYFNIISGILLEVILSICFFWLHLYCLLNSVTLYSQSSMCRLSSVWPTHAWF
jgi:hypothetical protein